MRQFLTVLNSLILLPPLVVILISGLVTWGIGRILGLKKTAQYGFNLMIGVDQMANVVLLGFPDETISGRTGRAIVSGSARWYIRIWWRILDFAAACLGDPNHSIKSIEDEDAFNEREELWYWSK